jgi:hypothetical protein
MPQRSDPATKTPVRGEDASEVGVWLEGCDEPIRTEGDDSGTDPGPATVLADPLPHQPCAADLGEGREHEEKHGACDCHGRTLS